MSSAHGAVVLPIKLRSLPSPNVFEKWQSGWVTLPHKAVLETAAFLVCHHFVKMVSPPLIFQWPYLLLSVNYEINVVDSDFFFASLTET